MSENNANEGSLHCPPSQGSEQGLALAGKSSGVYTGVALATAVMAILPVIVAYLFLQRYVIRSVISSGVKG